MISAAGARDAASPIVQAVADGTIDVAIVWGPAAGWFAAHLKTPLALTPTPALDGREWPMTFDISMGVRQGNDALKVEVDRALWSRREAIGEILDRFAVPRVGNVDAPIAHRQSAKAATGPAAAAGR